MEFTPLSDLQVGQHGSTIKCRIARIWDSTNHALQEQLISLDSLLVDEQGTSIQASIRKADAPRMRELIHEGRIYKIANFIVATSRNSFKVSPCDKTLYLGTWTIIREITETPTSIPANSFNFAEFTALESRVYNDIHLTDIIGQIMSVGKLKMTYTNGRMVGRKSIIINVIGKEKVSVTLWGTIANNFNEVTTLELAKKEDLIAVFAAMTIRTFQGNITLSSTNATKIYLNLAIPEIEEFHNRMIDTGKINSAHEHATHITEQEDDAIPESKNIEDLLALNPYFDKGKKYTCKATIAYIDASRGWYYNACGKCQSGTTNYDGLFACNRCGPITGLPIPWYKVSMMVTDATGGAKFIMIGKHFEKLVKISAADLCENTESKKNVLPPKLKELRGKEFSFTVAMDDKDDDPTSISFKILQVLTDETTFQNVEKTKRTLVETSSENSDANQKGKKTREPNTDEEFPPNMQYQGSQT